MPTTFLQTSFYWENFIYFGMGPKRGADGKLRADVPARRREASRASRPRTSARAAYGIFKGGDEFIGKTVSIAGEHLDGAEFAAAFSKALGEPVAYNDVSPDAYRGFGFPGADDIGNMFQFKHDFEDEYRAPRDPAAARKLNPALQSFETWLGENLSRIPIA